MRYLKFLIITIFLLFIPAKAFASTCDIISSDSLRLSTLEVSYTLNDNTYGYASSTNNSVLLPTNTKSIDTINKTLNLNFSSDEILLLGSLAFVSYGDAIDNTNPNLPNINSLPAPFVVWNGDSTKRSYCEFVDTSISTSNNFLQDLGSTSTTLYTPKLSHFNFTLRCHRNQDFPTETSNYRLLFSLRFGLFPNTDLSLNTSYYVYSYFGQTYLQVSSSCSQDDILGAIQSMNYDVLDISDKIDTLDSDVVDVGDKLDNIGDFLSDDSVSTSVLGATNFFNQQDGSYYGLADFVSAVINFMKAIYNDYSCTPLELPALLGTTITLPCFSEWLHDFNETIYNLWKMVLYFYVGFVICSDLIKFIHDLRDPQNDNLTVMDI